MGSCAMKKYALFGKNVHLATQKANQEVYLIRLSIIASTTTAFTQSLQSSL